MHEPPAELSQTKDINQANDHYRPSGRFLLEQYHAADQRLAKLIVRAQTTLRNKPCSILPPVARKQCRTHGKPGFFLSVLNILFRVLFFVACHFVTHVKIS